MESMSNIAQILNAMFTTASHASFTTDVIPQVPLSAKLNKLQPKLVPRAVCEGVLVLREEGQLILRVLRQHLFCSAYAEDDCVSTP